MGGPDLIRQVHVVKITHNRNKGKLGQMVMTPRLDVSLQTAFREWHVYDA